jgi:hypothetical protein
MYSVPIPNLFDIYTDASDYQLGACVMQDGNPVAYYSKKLNSAQKNYATMDKELLTNVMTLNEFRSMLLGAVINIHTDHINVLMLGDSSQRCLRWISYVDKYGPTLHYIKGSNNVIADTFSCMPMKNTTPLIMVGKEEPTADPLDCHFSVTDDNKMIECIAYLPKEECYLNLPADSAVDNPLDMEMIKEQQDADNDLQRQATKYADRYVRKSVSSVDNVLCYVKPGDPPANWKISLPKSMLQPTIRWFHQITGHPGSKCLHMQISYYHRDLRRLIDNYKCDHCQCYKLEGKGYGHLPEHEICSMPFKECAVD